jgi:energy-coupling factor transporter ATP-binding protein EcfA2
MAAPTGALGHFQALPFPARLAIGFLGMMCVIWLTRWLGGLSLPLAVLLWIVVTVGVWRADGGLTWADRYPKATRVLDRFAPRVVLSMGPVSSADASVPAREVPASASEASAAPRSGEAPAGSTATARAAPDVSRFVGLDGVFAEIHQLVTARANRISTVAPATIVLLTGPRGTGKSSVALALAAELRAAGALGTDRIVPLGPMETPGLVGVFGSTDAAATGVSDRIQAAIDGTLLIDDLDWLAGSPEGQAATEVGNRLLAMARRYPGRLFVIATGSAAAVSRLDPGNRWLGQLNARRIDFPPLSASALRDIFVRLLEEKGLSLAPGADRAVDIQIEERRVQAGEDFDNAHAVRRLVDGVLHSHGLRVHEGGTLAAEARRIVTADDVRNAAPSL